eukprot:12408869-Prorocentrum_lima.AAC.1
MRVKENDGYDRVVCRKLVRFSFFWVRKRELECGKTGGLSCLDRLPKCENMEFYSDLIQKSGLED